MSDEDINKIEQICDIKLLDFQKESLKRMDTSKKRYIVMIPKRDSFNALRLAEMLRIILYGGGIGE